MKSPFYKVYTVFFITELISDIIFFYLLITSPVQYRFLFWNNPDMNVFLLYRSITFIKAIGYAAIVYRIEKGVFQESKHIITYLFFILIFLGQFMVLYAYMQYGTVFNPIHLIGTILSLIGFGLTFFIPIGYISIGLKSSGIVRKKALSVGAAFILIILYTLSSSAWYIEVMGAGEFFGLELGFIYLCIMKLIAISILFFGFK